MATQFIQNKFAGTETAPTAIHDDAIGRSIIRNVGKATGICYDPVAGKLKYNANGQIRAISDSVATVLEAPLERAGQPQVAVVDLDGAVWHEADDELSWSVPEDVVVTRVIVVIQVPSDEMAGLHVSVTHDDGDQDVLINALELGTEPVCIQSNEDPFVVVAGTPMLFKASADPTGVDGRAFISYFTL